MKDLPALMDGYESYDHLLMIRITVLSARDSLYP